MFAQEPPPDFDISCRREPGLLRAADLWVQASLDQRQRFQQLFFPDGIAFDGKGFVGTRVTAPAFSYLREIQSGNKGWWT
jgi:hypothetical protein